MLGICQPHLWKLLFRSRSSCKFYGLEQGRLWISVTIKRLESSHFKTSGGRHLAPKYDLLRLSPLVYKNLVCNRSVWKSISENWARKDKNLLYNYKNYWFSSKWCKSQIMLPNWPPTWDDRSSFVSGSVKSLLKNHHFCRGEKAKKTTEIQPIIKTKVIFKRHFSKCHIQKIVRSSKNGLKILIKSEKCQRRKRNQFRCLIIVWTVFVSTWISNENFPA